MTDRKQKAAVSRGPFVTGGLTILAAVVTLAVPAASVGSTGSSNTPARSVLEGASRQAVLYNGHAGSGANTAHRRVNASGGWDPTLRTARGRADRVIADLGVKYT